ncbi:MAG: hypothetical protein LRY75_04925, partial [Shewanella xiamenensis]|nr:hypothetical protein [Shewanella xiamenensis]
MRAARLLVKRPIPQLPERDLPSRDPSASALWHTTSCPLKFAFQISHTPLFITRTEVQAALTCAPIRAGIDPLGS